MWKLSTKSSTEQSIFAVKDHVFPLSSLDCESEKIMFHQSFRCSQREKKISKKINKNIMHSIKKLVERMTWSIGRKHFWRMIDDDSWWKMWIASVALFSLLFDTVYCYFQSNFFSTKDLFNGINIMSAVNCWNNSLHFIAKRSRLERENFHFKVELSSRWNFPGKFQIKKKFWATKFWEKFEICKEKFQG